MKPSLFLVAAVVSLSSALIACDDAEEETPDVAPSATAAVTSMPAVSPSSPPPTSTPAIIPGPGETLYRWVNVRVLIPDDSGISAAPGIADELGGLPHFVIVKVEPEDSRIASTVVLDSENGAIVEEEVLDEHREEIDRVLSTLSVGPFERSSAPWPYTGELTSNLVRENEGGISWLRPSPSTGLYVGFGFADPGGFFVDLRNERSAAFAGFYDAPDKLTFDTSSVLAEDLPVFERWLSTLRHCGTEIEC